MRIDASAFFYCLVHLLSYCVSLSTCTECANHIEKRKYQADLRVHNSMMADTSTGLNSFLRKFNFKLADASPEYIQRRKKQMILFTTAAAVTIFTSRFAYKSTVTRQYVPTLFQGNHMPPLGYNFTTDAAVAVGTGTMLCASVSSMIVFGTCWIMDVSTFKEFGWRMKATMGGIKKEKEYAAMPMDEDSAYIQDGLNDILDGNFDPNFDDLE